MKKLNLNGFSFDGWIKKHVATVITIVVLGGGITAQAAVAFNNQSHMKTAIKQNCIDIEKSGLKLDTLDTEIGDDLSDIKGDIKEIKAILRERDN